MSSENGLKAWFIPWDADIGLDGIVALCLGAKGGGKEAFIVALALTLFRRLSSARDSPTKHFVLCVSF